MKSSPKSYQDFLKRQLDDLQTLQLLWLQDHAKPKPCEVCGQTVFGLETRHGFQWFNENLTLHSNGCRIQYLEHLRQQKNRRSSSKPRRLTASELAYRRRKWRLNTLENSFYVPPYNGNDSSLDTYHQNE